MRTLVLLSMTLAIACGPAVIQGEVGSTGPIGPTGAPGPSVVTTGILSCDGPGPVEDTRLSVTRTEYGDGSIIVTCSVLTKSASHEHVYTAKKGSSRVSSCAVVYALAGYSGTWNFEANAERLYGGVIYIASGDPANGWATDLNCHML